MFSKLKRQLYIKYLAFKRQPFLFFKYLFFIILFRFLGIIICLFFTILPLPLSNFLQHLMNLNLSFNSVKDILSSIKQIAHNFNNLIPSFNDISRFMKSLLMNFSPNNIIQILRQLPSDFRQFCLQFFDHLRQRLTDLKIFCKSLWPLSNAISRLKNFIITHTLMFKRLIRNLIIMLFNLICLKILFLLIIPFLSIGAIYFIGVDISLLIIAFLSLLTSQLGNLIGKAINTLLLKLYAKVKKHRQLSTINIFLFIFILIYAKISRILTTLRTYLIINLLLLLKNICNFFIAITIYLKIKYTHLGKDYFHNE